MQLLSAVAGTGGVYHMDIFDLCAAAPRGSVDMILADLPYGTTNCAWDTVIPFAPMWAAFKRIIKPRGAIVLTASQPFTSALVMSNPDWFKYTWVWSKPNGTNFLNAPFQPLKTHEDVIIFSAMAASFNPAGAMAYYPEIGKGMPYKWNSKKSGGYQFHSHPDYDAIDNTGSRYPRSVLEFAQERGLHDTQKPVDLFRYLIRTYTRPGELVFDPCVGSGTTAIAAREEGRRFIVGDSSSEYVQVARDRLAMPYTPSFMPILEAV